MNYLRALYIIIILWFAVCLNTNSIGALTKVPVTVSHIGDDQIGKLLEYQIKEGIRQSNSLRLVPFEESKIMMLILTMDMDEKHPNHSSAFSVIWLLRNGPHREFWTQKLGFAEET